MTTTAMGAIMVEQPASLAARIAASEVRRLLNRPGLKRVVAVAAAVEDATEPATEPAPPDDRTRYNAVPAGWDATEAAPNGTP